MVFAFILNRVIKESPNLQNSADINVFLHIDTCHLSWGGVKRLFWSRSFKTCGFETYGPAAAAAAAVSLQLCPTLCNPIDSSPPGFPVPGILQARTLEWVAISSSNAWKWKVKVKSLSRVQLLATPGLQTTRLLHPWDSPGKSTGVGCHCLLRMDLLVVNKE